MDLYMNQTKMWRKNPASDKTWANFRKFFAEEYHDLHEIQRINETLAGFHGTNMAIAIQDKISKSLENFVMAIPL